VKKPPGPLRALAASARLANLPSVVSNVWCGLLLGGAGLFDSGAATMAAVSLYLCGTFVNDWADRGWDQTRRPERALPRGLFPPAMYLSLALALAASGLGTAALAGPHALTVAALIALCILLYTWLHKKTAWAIVWMALCRALLPLLGLAASAQHALWPVASIAGLALFCHVAGISLFARRESLPQQSGGGNLATWCFVACALMMTSSTFVMLKLPPAACLLAIVPYATWTCHSLLRHKNDTGARVSSLLAGIPLADWMLLLPLALAHGAGTTPALWLPPLAFLTGRALQRLAPAT